MKISNIIVESDSQVSIKSITSQTQVPNRSVNLIEDIKKLQGEVQNIRPSFCTKSTNSLADK